jgi:hypothetical protein
MVFIFDITRYKWPLILLIHGMCQFYSVIKLLNIRIKNCNHVNIQKEVQSKIILVYIFS